MKAYKDKTMDHAMNSVGGEWKYMVRLAIKLRTGKIDPRNEKRERRKFTGIYKRLLEDPLNELYQERDGKIKYAS